jgi:hypothetical protein
LNFKLQTLDSSYYIVISRTNQALLSFLKLRIIVDNKDIYPLVNDKPVIIPVTNNHPKIVASDGYHFTKPLELDYKEPSYYTFSVTCAIEDIQLLGGGLLVFFYLLGFWTGVFILKLISFLPVIYFLFLYYFRRREFIRITPIRPRSRARV